MRTGVELSVDMRKPRTAISLKGALDPAAMTVP